MIITKLAARYRAAHTPDAGVGEEFESGTAYWEYTRQFSGVASVLAQIPADQHEKVAEEIAVAAGGGDANTRVALKTEALLASGVK